MGESISKFAASYQRGKGYTDEGLRERGEGFWRRCKREFPRFSSLFKIRASVFGSVPELVEEWVVYDTQDNALVDNKADGYANQRESMYEICCSIYKRRLAW